VSAPGTASPASSGPGKRPLVVGLTGGIGSGKSTVAEGFAALGVPVIDADQLARELVEPGQPALEEIIAVFGVNCTDGDGKLDRDYMRRQIFADATHKRQLEAILHPKIRQRIMSLLAAIDTPYCIVVIPLLLETGQTDLVDRILVIDTPEKEQLKRVAARDGLTHNAVMAIMATQSDRSTRLNAADDVIINDTDLDSLTGRIQELHQLYMELSHDH
jgi:dephospho-CoA kinase